MFNTSVDDMVVLVVDENHPRYRQIGKMLYHDWKEYGGMGVRFADGHNEEFYDGIMKGDPPSQIRRFYRHMDKTGEKYDGDGAGPETFQREFAKHGGNLETLMEQYKALFGKNLPAFIKFFNQINPSSLS